MWSCTVVYMVYYNRCVTKYLGAIVNKTTAVKIVVNLRLLNSYHVTGFMQKVLNVDGIKRYL